MNIEQLLSGRSALDPAWAILIHDKDKRILCYRNERQSFKSEAQAQAYMAEYLPGSSTIIVREPKAPRPEAI